MNTFPRVALFADTFYEINGAANVIRRLTNFAAEKERPFLCVRAGCETRRRREGSLEILELKRGRCAVAMDGELKYDPLFWGYKNLVRSALADFQPDVLHLTGINDISQIGFYLAHFQNIPAVVSWHTNLHEYAASRLTSGFFLLRRLPVRWRLSLGKAIEMCVLRGLMRLHFLAQMQLAPNEELVAQIRRMTNRPTALMSRGVDAEFLHPGKRRRADEAFVLGYVGRLRPEKNVRFLAEVERRLAQAKIKNYRFVLVGEGAEEGWLRQNMRNVELTGVLRGEELARAFADMDLFVFPSKTDAFGNVVLEAMAAGVPAVVMSDGGPKFLIENGVNGYAAQSDDDFLSSIAGFAREPERLPAMRSAARLSAATRDWEKVFENLYENYKLAAALEKNVRAQTAAQFKLAS
jgi:phosphatidylinositol alpha 1,6-mannosyltransferase